MKMSGEYEERGEVVGFDREVEEEEDASETEKDRMFIDDEVVEE